MGTVRNMAEPLSKSAQTSSENELLHLQAQVKKWRVQVPKLVKAMRVRSEALAAAQAELRELRRRLGNETPVHEQLRQSELKVQLLETDLAAHRESSEKELDSLGERNRSLFETVQIANAQLERVGAAVSDLQSQISSRDSRISELEALLSERAPATSADCLTRVRGIGAKLAAQLRDAGIDALAALAELEDADLDSPEHPLHAHRARARRDDWIGQARTLTNEQDALPPTC